MIIPNGKTDVTTYWVMRDSTNHAPKSDVTITDIDVYYQEQGAAQSAKADLTALAAADSAHSDNKGYNCGNSVYRIDWPDAAFDGGIGKRVYLIVVCSGCDTLYKEVLLSPKVDVASISDDSTAADNCELMFDGTGYAGGTTKLGVDAVAISGDSTAADNLEKAVDGTGLTFTNCVMPTTTTVTNEVTADVTKISGDATAANNLEAALDGTGGVTITAALTGNITGNLSGSVGSVTGAVGSVTGAVGSVTGNVGGNVAGSVASVTAGVTLADDAITSAKFDESTAFPLKSADTGATAVARTGADSDTLETLSDQLDGITLTASDIADAVWDEALAGHADAGSAGAGLAAAGAAGDPWSTLIPGAYGAGTAGKILGDNINAPIGTVNTVVDAIKAVTDAIPNAGALTDIASAITVIDGIVDDILVDTGTTLDTLIKDIPTNAELASAFTEIKGATWDSGTDTLEAIRNKETDIETDTQDLQTQVGVDGAGLTALPWNAAWDAEVQSECTDALDAYDPPTKAELDTGLDALPTAAEIKTAIEAAGGHLALILEDTGTTLPGTLTTILADTNELQGDITNGGRIDLLVDAIKAKTDNIPASPAAVGSAMTLANNAITAAVIATDAIDADAIKADALAEIADAVWDEATSGHSGAGTFGKAVTDFTSPLGSGAITWTYTVTDGTDPIDNVQVWVTTDEAGTNIIASGYTNSSGVVTFYLDGGTYYLWSQKSGYTFTNPDTETVS